VVVVGSVATGRHDRWSDVDAIVWANDAAVCFDALEPTLDILAPRGAFDVKVWPTDESFESRAARFSDLGFALVLLDGFNVGELHVGNPDAHTHTLGDRYRTSLALRRQCVVNYLERRRSIADGIVDGTVAWCRHEARRLLETPKAVQRQIARLDDDLASELAMLEVTSFQVLSDLWSIVVNLQEGAADGAVAKEEYERALLEMAPASALASAEICTRALRLACR
jgi:hypothetical protein